jgi:FkbM family methyltransferase
MIANLHRLALKNRWTRSLDRKCITAVKRALNIPDAYAEMAKIFRRTPGAIVLDIGSNRGETVLKMLDYMPEATIHAFEPTPAAAAELCRRLKGWPNVRVHEIALCDRTGRIRLQCNANEQANSVLRNAALPALESCFGLRSVGEVEVRAETLDDWIAREHINVPLIVKADIQGAERLLIKGGGRAFGQQVVLFYSEISILPQYEGQAEFSEIQNILTKEYEFALVDIFPCGRDGLGRAAFTDALWVKTNVLEAMAHQSPKREKRPI